LGWATPSLVLSPRVPDSEEGALKAVGRSVGMIGSTGGSSAVFAERTRGAGILLQAQVPPSPRRDRMREYRWPRSWRAFAARIRTSARLHVHDLRSSITVSLCGVCCPEGCRGCAGACLPEPSCPSESMSYPGSGPSARPQGCPADLPGYGHGREQASDSGSTKTETRINPPSVGRLTSVLSATLAR
jgi:hypothetical protein